jgi:hypothetical protein
MTQTHNSTWRKHLAAIATLALLWLTATPALAAKPSGTPPGQQAKLEQQTLSTSADAETPAHGKGYGKVKPGLVIETTEDTSSSITSSTSSSTPDTSSTFSSSTETSTDTSSAPITTTTSTGTTATSSDVPTETSSSIVETNNAPEQPVTEEPTAEVQSSAISQDNALVPTDCNQTEWHWIINQLGGRTKPASITVYFDTGTVVVPLDTHQASEDVAHYTLTTHLGDSLVAPGATTTLENAETWAGRFNLSHGPCVVPLEVIKTAETSFTRTWQWTIEKSADQTDLGTLQPGDMVNVNYQVTVAASSTDSAWTVSGDISIHNAATNPDATIEGVSDVLSTSGALAAGDIDCGVITFPFTLAPDATLTCTYSKSLSGPVDQTNTATVTTSGTVPGGSDTSAVTFSSSPSTEIDECINVSDTLGGSLGTVCAGSTPATFNYTLSFGRNELADEILDCGSNTVLNTASFVTNDTANTGSDNWTITATVECEFGCTLTQGYWKTHSEFGPAPYDNTWAQLANGASTTFFLSSQAWYEVFQTEPAGNAYYILAHQYMAAHLNQLAGASMTGSVLAAFSDVTELFNTYTPAQIAASASLTAEATDLAGTLASYNEGALGPGHCGDQSAST